MSVEQPVRTGLFKYVVHHRVAEHHRAGWMIVQADLGRYHGCFSVLMWRCGCDELTKKESIFVKVASRGS